MDSIKIFDKIVDLHINNRECTVFWKKLKNGNDDNINLNNYYNLGSILEVFSFIGGLGKITDGPIFHFKSNLNLKRNLPDTNIVIHCNSNEEIRNWDQKKWNKLAVMLINLGYDISEVGFINNINIDNNHYHNFCSKKTLQEIAFLIKNSILFIGIDSAFAHMANAVNTPGIILLGHYKNFKKYMPFTGKYCKPNFATIIQFDGQVKDIPINLVYENAIMLLNTKLN